MKTTLINLHYFHFCAVYLFLQKACRNSNKGLSNTFTFQLPSRVPVDHDCTMGYDIVYEKLLSNLVHQCNVKTEKKSWLDELIILNLFYI